MDKQKLRIGLLVESFAIPLWAYKMIESIKNSDHSEILLIVSRQTKKTKAPSGFLKLWKKRKHLAYHLYTAVEDTIHSLSLNAFQSKNLSNLIDSPTINVELINSTIGNEIIAGDIAQIKEYNIDVFININFKSIRGSILKVPKYGIWSFYHGNNDIKYEGRAGSKELFEKLDETRVYLQILTDNNNEDEIIIYETSFSNDNLYVNRHKNNIYWKSNTIIPRKLNELYHLGSVSFLNQLKKQKPNDTLAHLSCHHLPNNVETIKGISQLYWNAFKGVIRRQFYFDQWIILFKLDLVENPPTSFSRFNRITPSKDRFWADPFIVERNDIFYIFIEELIYNDNRGKIAVIEMDKSGNYSESKVVLEKKYHLSYPFLIEDQGELYMLPETMENETIELYRCVHFPYKWELVEVLMDNVKAVDSTLYKLDNKYWLFTNVEAYHGVSTINELHLFHSDNLIEGNWMPHAQNPIVVDRSNSRPAGNIFESNNRIFRPAQNCTKHYGHGMKINEIMTLNEDEYKERQIQSIYPDWDKDVLSTHTFNSSGRLTVIDAKIKRRK